jgi:peptide/nickel transport system permease protein
VTRYIIRRLLQSVPLLFLISLLSFGIMFSSPVTMLNPAEFPEDSSQEDLQRILAQHGLDRPWYVLYGEWVGRLAVGDLGESYQTRQPVTRLILERLPATLQLTVTALLLSLVLGVLLGVLAALNQNSWIDSFTRIFAVAGHAVPAFWLGLVLIWVFAVHLHLLPAGGYNDVGADDWDVGLRLKHLILPSLVLAFSGIANMSRYVRGEMLEVIRQDYIRTARAKGLAESIVRYRHALRNALIPVITILGLSLRGLFGGAALIETIFAWPGMGQLIVAQAFARDYPVVMGTTFIGTFLVIVGALLADVAYAWADPRIRLQ